MRCLGFVTVLALTLIPCESTAELAPWIREIGLHGELVVAVDFSPVAPVLATACADGVIRLWDSSSGQILFSIPTGTSEAFDVRFSPDGALLALGCRRGELQVRDSMTGTLVRLFTGHQDMVFAADFSPNGMYVVSGGSDSTVRLWNMATGQVLWSKAHHTGGGVSDVRFLPNGQSIVSVGGDGRIVISQASTGNVIRQIVGHTTSINRVAILPDGSLLATASSDNTATIWRVADLSPVKTFTSHSFVRSVAFSPTGEYFAYGETNAVRVLRTDTYALVKVFGVEVAFDLAFSPSMPVIATGLQSKRASAFRYDTGSTHFHTGPHRDVVTGIAFSRDRRRLATSSDDKQIILWNANSVTPMRTISTLDPATCVTFSADSKRIATGDHGSNVIVWNAESGAKLKTLLGHGQQVRCVAFHPSDNYIVSGSVDGDARIWDGTTYELRHVLTEHDGFVEAVAFSPDGQFLATGGSDAKVCIWNPATGTLIRTIGQNRDVLDVAFHPTKPLLAVANKSRATVVNYLTGSIVKELELDSQWAVAFTPEGRFLITSSGTNRIKFYDSTTWTERAILQSNLSGAYDIEVSPDGTRLAVGGTVSGIMRVPTVHDLAPTSFMVRRGVVEVGNLNSLELDDGNGLIVAPFVVPKQGVPETLVEVEGRTSVANPHQIRMEVRAAGYPLAQLLMRAEIYDFAANQWDSKTSISVLLGPVFQRFTIESSGAANRYVGPNGRLLMRCFVTPGAPGLSRAWSSVVDRVQWIVVE